MFAEDQSFEDPDRNPRASRVVPAVKFVCQFPNCGYIASEKECMKKHAESHGVTGAPRA